MKILSVQSMWNFTPVHSALKGDSRWITVFTTTEPFFHFWTIPTWNAT